MERLLDFILVVEKQGKHKNIVEEEGGRAAKYSMNTKLCAVSGTIIQSDVLLVFLFNRWASYCLKCRYRINTLSGFAKNAYIAEGIWIIEK